MNRKDAWFLGLLALAYLYVDATPAPRAMSDDLPERRAERAPSRLLPVRVVPRAVCPRDQLHPVAHRADGAIWCRGCDEAFYPQGTIWKAIMHPVAV